MKCKYLRGNAFERAFVNHTTFIPTHSEFHRSILNLWAIFCVVLKSLRNRVAPYRPTPFLTPARHQHSGTIGPGFSVWHPFCGPFPRTLRATCKLPPPVFQHLPVSTCAYWAHPLSWALCWVLGMLLWARRTSSLLTRALRELSTCCAVGAVHILPAPVPSSVKSPPIPVN